MVIRGRGPWVRLGRLACALGLVFLAALPADARAHRISAATTSSALGEIRRIIRGLGVQPPKQKEYEGRVQDPLYNLYGLQTRRQQLASTGFADGTILYINQNTSLVLSSPRLTEVTKGEVGQTLTPGTNHRIQTAAAVASAVGTDFDIQATGKKSSFYVREGSLLVSNSLGSVYVTTGQGVGVRTGRAPETPFPYTAAQYARAFLWRKALTDPLAPQDTNIALAANCGSVLAASSEQTSGSAMLAIDGRLDRGWVTADGQTTNQSLTLGFCHAGKYLVSGVVLSTAPFGTISAAAEVKDFAIAVSTTGTADSDFHTIFTGTATQKAGLQRFPLPHPVTATHVRLLAMNNAGDPTRLALTEFEVVGRPKSSTTPSVSPCYLAAPCIATILTMINTARERSHLATFPLDPVLSTGSGNCVGAYGHSVAMAASGRLWHTNPQFPQASYPADVCSHTPTHGENVGLGVSGGEQTDIQTLLANFLREPHNAQTCRVLVRQHTTNHACNIFARQYRRIGIGLYFADARTWLTIVFSA